MKVYILRNGISVYIYSELYETPEFYIVPSDKGVSLEIFNKSQWKLEITQATKAEANNV